MSLIAWIHDRLTQRKMQRLFSRGEDPYSYRTSSYEQIRFRKTLEALGKRRFGKILEAGCGEGVLTRSLAERADRVTALDISEAALSRARERLSSFGDRIVFVHENVRDWVKRVRGTLHFDLVVLSEMLYYLGEKEEKIFLLEPAFVDFLRDLCGLLMQGGLLLMAHGFCNSEERKIREGYRERLLRLGLKPLGEWVAGEAPHDKGTARCLIHLLEKI
ncbi:MAG: class I SAM-dependent methyltransferase [Elusimicrobia bacterium]|nr:class I SAM-dependent methyltransferase [Elusimicrobiota bacterium]